jgi:hypothetical protein
VGFVPNFTGIPWFEADAMVLSEIPETYLPGVARNLHLIVKNKKPITATTDKNKIITNRVNGLNPVLFPVIAADGGIVAGVCADGCRTCACGDSFLPGSSFGLLSVKVVSGGGTGCSGIASFVRADCIGNCRVCVDGGCAGGRGVAAEACTAGCRACVCGGSFLSASFFCAESTRESTGFSFCFRSPLKKASNDCSMPFFGLLSARAVSGGGIEAGACVAGRRACAAEVCSDG